MLAESICIHCKAQIFRYQDNWMHPYGNVYCQDKNGFAATPIRRATPVFYDADSVL